MSKPKLSPAQVNFQAACPWCSLPLAKHAPAWTCGSFPGWEGGKPHQSIACAEIAQLKARVAKLERVAKAAKVLNCYGKHSTDKAWANLLKSLKDLEAPDE